MTGKKTKTSIKTGKVIVLGCYPPRKCGIATFTRDTVESLLEFNPASEITVIAMAETGDTAVAGGPVVRRIRQHDLGSYIDAASYINDQNPDCLIIQHEFGIFGGTSGEYLLTLLALIRVPVVTIFHTVLEQPDYGQTRVMRRLVHRSSRLVVMAERGAAMLRDVYGAPVGRVSVVPHGAPMRPYAEPAEARRTLGIDCENMISTFGLLSPNKGIESVICAMPEVLARFPKARYFIIGVTHPHLVAREGETYRRSLEALAIRLGVEANVEFIDRFVDNQELFDYLQASDIYITPYLNPAQITSGTLSYALALGCYVVSTPYWHAQEALTQCPGTLVPAADAEAISAALVAQLRDPEGLASRRREVYAWAEPTRWPVFAERLSGLIAEAARPGGRGTHISELHGPAYPAIALKAIERMTDNCGIFQHSRFAMPDREHGYCVDDNARALILCNDIIRRGMFGADIARLHAIYASFVLHAFQPETGRFRNFMDYGRSWVAHEPCDDSQGRAFWATAHAAATPQHGANDGWASTVVQQAVGRAEQITSPRAKALVILGCGELMQSELASDVYAALMHRFANELCDQLVNCRSDSWDWLEETLSYDNGRIPQAMLVAAQLGGDTRLARAALSSLGWLCGIQLIDQGMFAPVGSESFGRVRQPPLPYDQQPIEAAAMLDACSEAYKVSRDRIWWHRARTIMSWFYGLNSHDLSLVDPVTGHCHDGLNRSGLNLNAGAESLLAFQMAVCKYQAFVELVDVAAPAEQLPASRKAERV